MNIIQHTAQEGQKWGYNDGKPNGKRKAGENIKSPSNATYTPTTAVMIGKNGSKLHYYTSPKTYEEYKKEKKDKTKQKIEKFINDYFKKLEETNKMLKTVKPIGKDLFDKMSLKHSDKDYIEHHGREGMEWGKRNGPPYPLENAKKMGERIVSRIQAGMDAVNKFLEENEKKRINDIKQSDDVKLISKNIDLFTTQELQDKVNRQRMLRELKDQMPKKKEGFIKKTMTGISNGLSSKISNALVDKIANSIIGNNNTKKMTYEEARKLGKDFIQGRKDEDGKVYSMSSQEIESLFKTINNAQSIQRILKEQKS